MFIPGSSLFPCPPSLPGFHTSVGGGGERQDADWYVTHGIRFQGDTRVVDLDVRKKVVRCDDGTAYSYSKLIIATGAEVSHCVSWHLGLRSKRV
jgi:monodehydroascorbate reductase (NADH)